MHPELFTLPGGYSIKTYGFFMMIGFLSGVWLAMRRAARVKADPDVVLDMALVSLIFGIAGARLFYVIHYWESQFADVPNPIVAIIDITAGGLEFLGGFLGAVIATTIHAYWKKYSLRLYLDIAAPSAIWGLGIGRIGCYFNGCCFGAVAAAAPVGAADAAVTPRASQAAAIPWAVQFPYGSPAHIRHWEQRLVTVPAELVSTPKDILQPFLLPEQQLFMPVEQRQGMLRRIQDLETAARDAKERNASEAKRIQRELESAKMQAGKDLRFLLEAQSFPSRVNPQRNISVSELQELAHGCSSMPVHPAQLYATAGALLLAALLGAIFYKRKRHGMVIGVLLLLYPVQRTLEEIIRADNPQDVAGLTVSQSISVILFLMGVVYLVVLYKYLPERSPMVAAPTRTDLEPV